MHLPGRTRTLSIGWEGALGLGGGSRSDSLLLWLVSEGAFVFFKFDQFTGIGFSASE